MKYNISQIINTIIKKLNQLSLSHRLYITIFILLIILAIIAFFYMQNQKDSVKDTVKEGFNKQVSIYDSVKKVIISQKPGSWDWLHIGEFKIYDQNGRELAFNEYTVTSSSGIYNNNQGYRVYNLADNNHGTMFHSGGGDCTLTFTINNPTRVSKIYMKQRKDCCQGRIRAYKMRLLNTSDTTMADINLADSGWLYNPSYGYADWFYFYYPEDPQIAIAREAAKKAAQGEAERAAAAEAQLAADKAKREADKAKRSSATTLYAIEEADAAERSAKDDATEVEKDAKQAKDLAKEADIDAANSNINANDATTNVKNATNISSEFQQQVNQAIAASENEIKALAASITPQPRSEAVPYNSAEINQF